MVRKNKGKIPVDVYILFHNTNLHSLVIITFAEYYMLQVKITLFVLYKGKF